MQEDLVKIKKIYGEDMAKLCRELFPTLLETPGLLSDIIISKFEPNRLLYNDIVSQDEVTSFRDYIYSLANLDREPVKTDKTVKELLSEAGYDFYECKSKEDIDKFKKYYAKDELICTFLGDRLKSCYVFFIVKKDVDEIHREDFIKPKRQDRYGTSVVSIQFSRGKTNILSIKNRYNDSVNNPDATFGNDLDNIIPGLTYAFIKEYNLNIEPDNISTFGLDYYKRVKGEDKLYKYNYLTGNSVYTHDNKVITFNNEKRIDEVTRYDQSRYLLIDYYLVDYEKKEIRLIDNNIKDCFTDQFANITKIVALNEGDNKRLTISMKDKEDVVIIVDKLNRIIGLKNPNIKVIKDNFMGYNVVLNNLELDNVVSIGNSFLSSNLGLESLSMPSLEEVGSHFVSVNENINNINFPNLRRVKDSFLFNNYKLLKVDFPNLDEVGTSFMFMNKILNSFIAPRLSRVDDYFLTSNKGLEVLDLLSLKQVGSRFIRNNENIYELKIFNIVEVGDEFLFANSELENLVVPWLKRAGRNFMYMNEKMAYAKFGSLEEVSDNFMCSNEKLKAIFPKLTRVGDNFLASNTGMKDLNFIKLEERGSGFLEAHPYRNKIKLNWSLRRKELLEDIKSQKGWRIKWKTIR